MEMKSVKVRIKGVQPLLMNNPMSMRGESDRKRIPTAEDEAASKAYWSDDRKTLVIHADHIMGSVLNAARPYRKEGSKYSVVADLAGSTQIMPEKISLNTDQYEIDTRTAVVQKQRIVRSRAKVWPWEASFEWFYNPEEFSDGFVLKTLQEILARAGRSVGILDFRPQHKGHFGMFTVDAWEMNGGTPQKKSKR